MAHRLSVSFHLGVIAISFNIASICCPAAEKGSVLTGKAAMGDWTSDAPGVMRKITVQDLPPPSSNALAINGPRVVARPPNAQPKVPPGFKSNYTPLVFAIRDSC